MDAYRKNQNFWHFVSTMAYVALLAATAMVLYWKNGALPKGIEVKDWILIVFAIFRLTRMFVYDSVMSFVRDNFSEYEKGPGRTVCNLLDCPWCTSVWMALPVVFFYFLTPIAWYPIFILAVAGMGAFIQITIWKIGLEKED